MKPIRLLLLSAALVAGVLPAVSAAQSNSLASPDAAAGKFVAATEHDAAWLARAKAAYPLTTCVVCEDKLTHSGEPVAYIYKQPGQPDRLVLLCDDGCLPELEKSPAKYLKMIDEARAAKAKAAPTAK